MLDLIFMSMWFLLPAAYSNMAPVVVKKIPALDFLDIPVDGGRTFRGQPIFGRNKTLRGFMAGAIFGLIIGLAQYLASEQWSALNDLEFIELGASGYALLGILQGFGALVGDAVESFFKRQFKIKPGEAWVPMDQVDFVLGACIFSLPVVVLSASQYAVVVVTGTVFHPIITVIAWKLKFKDKPI